MKTRKRERRSIATPAKKYDEGKDPWQLLPWDALRGVVKALACGARKYEARNWEHGMDWDHYYRAAIEHLASWFQEGRPDPETGLSHLCHAGCCILFLIAYEMRGVGRDTRPLARAHSPARRAKSKTPRNGPQARRF